LFGRRRVLAAAPNGPSVKWACADRKQSRTKEVSEEGRCWAAVCDRNVPAAASYPAIPSAAFAAALAASTSLSTATAAAPSATVAATTSCPAASAAAAAIPSVTPAAAAATALAHHGGRLSLVLDHHLLCTGRGGAGVVRVRAAVPFQLHRRRLRRRRRRAVPGEWPLAAQPAKKSEIETRWNVLTPGPRRCRW